MYFSNTTQWASYFIGTRECIITPVKLLVAAVMFGFAVLICFLNVCVCVPKV